MNNDKLHCRYAPTMVTRAEFKSQWFRMFTKNNDRLSFLRNRLMNQLAKRKRNQHVCAGVPSTDENSAEAQPIWWRWFRTPGDLVACSVVQVLFYKWFGTPNGIFSSGTHHFRTLGTGALRTNSSAWSSAMDLNFFVCKAVWFLSQWHFNLS